MGPVTTGILLEFLAASFVHRAFQWGFCPTFETQVGGQ